MHIPHAHFHTLRRSAPTNDDVPFTTIFPRREDPIPFSDITTATPTTGNSMAPTILPPTYHMLATRAKGSPPECNFKNTGYPLLNQGTIAHQLVLVAIGIGAGIVLTLIFQLLKRRMGGGGGGGGPAPGGDPK